MIITVQKTMLGRKSAIKQFNVKKGMVAMHCGETRQGKLLSRRKGAGQERAAVQM